VQAAFSRSMHVSHRSAYGPLKILPPASLAYEPISPFASSSTSGS